VVLVYPPAVDAGDVETLAAARAAHQVAGGRACEAWYVVASTVDRVCPPEAHADSVATGLRALGARGRCRPSRGG
jgi:hypothetical protein